MKDGLEKSNLVIAKILRFASKHGVSEWTLKFGDLDLDKSYKKHFGPCILWLEAEGIIRVGNYGKSPLGRLGGIARDISLTSKGMALLGEDIVVDGRRISLARAVAEESQGSEGVYRIGELIGGIFGGAFKSMGS